MTPIKIAFGSDHCGYEPPAPFYKPQLIEYIESLGHEVVDCGTFDAVSVDYPDYADKVVEAMRDGLADRGVLLCGTGMGISVAANRHPGIRATVCVNEEMVELAREHNDSNVLCLGRRILSVEEARHLIKVWLETPFSGGERHQRRINKLG